jgi:hypothetical protein
VVFLPLLLLATSCGGRGDVSGKVTLDGKPLPAGTIVFQNGKKPAVSADIKDGGYTATGVPAGDVKVAVETKSVKEAAERLQSTLTLKVPGRDEKALAQQLKDLMGTYRPIPDKYADLDKSGLATKVASGTNQYDVPLASK